MHKFNELLKCGHDVYRFKSIRMKLEMKKALEIELKQLKLVVAEKDEKVLSVLKQLETERDEKMILLEETAQKQEEWHRKKQLRIEESEGLRRQLDEMIERANRNETSSSNQQARSLSEVDDIDIHDAYKKIIKEKEIIENENGEDIGYSSAKNTLEPKRQTELANCRHRNPYIMQKMFPLAKLTIR
uniref:Uncharacterized protein n=1 Tax=Glossina pallidipes TaxID=7398 RepID=A0A1A9Z4Z0_GLOPL